MAVSSRTAWVVGARVLASIVGGYAFTWGVIALGLTLLVYAGMPLDEAASLTTMLGFLIFLFVFCWAFIAPSLMRVGCVLFGGGAAMTLAGWGLSRALI